MNQEQKQFSLVALLLAVLLIAAAWSVMGMLDKRESARKSAVELADCQQIVDNIRELREKDSLVQSDGSEDEQERDLAQRVNDAATKVQLVGNWLQGIDHKRPTRVGDTPYMRKPAILLTRGLTLSQLAALVHELTYDSPLTAYDLKLRTPPGASEGNRWDADVTLTYLIYSPPETDRTGS